MEERLKGIDKNTKQIAESKGEGIVHKAVVWLDDYFYLRDRADELEDIKAKYLKLKETHENAVNQIDITQERNEKLEKEIQKHQNTLRFYGDKSMYVRRVSALDGLTSDIDFDSGKRARSMLESNR